MQFDKVRYLLGWKDGDIVTAIKNKGFETKIMSEAQLSYSMWCTTMTNIIFKSL